MSELKATIKSDMIAAMKAQDKQRLAAIRLIVAALKQKEIDERIELDDAQVLTILDKLTKQRRESITQYKKAQRDDLVQVEQFELEVIQTYLPEALTEDEINTFIADAIKSTQAESMKDMGKVIGLLKPKFQGRADMALVSQKIKQQLS